jgi:hypothetical protein
VNALEIRDSDDAHDVAEAQKRACGVASCVLP